jgi:hypothetical protein
MWVRTQNKKDLVNVEGFYIKEVGLYYQITTHKNTILGKYSTEQRALKVLDTIQKFIGINDVFQMPQDSEVK